MKDRHDCHTADIFEMSDTDILDWMRDHVIFIECLASDRWVIGYQSYGEEQTIESTGLKECVRLAANFKYGVASE